MVPRDSGERGHTRLSCVPLPSCSAAFRAAEQAKRVGKMDVRLRIHEAAPLLVRLALDGMHKKATPSCAKSIRH